MRQAQIKSLWDALGEVADERMRRGKRFELRSGHLVRPSAPAPLRRAQRSRCRIRGKPRRPAWLSSPKALAIPLTSGRRSASGAPVASCRKRRVPGSVKHKENSSSRLIQTSTTFSLLRGRCCGQVLRIVFPRTIVPKGALCIEVNAAKGHAPTSKGQRHSHSKTCKLLSGGLIARSWAVVEKTRRSECTRVSSGL